MGAGGAGPSSEAAPAGACLALRGAHVNMFERYLRFIHVCFHMYVEYVRFICP